MENQLSRSADKAEKFGNSNTRVAFLTKALVILLAVIAASLAWRFTPLSEWMDSDTVIAWQESLKSHPAALFLVVGAYLLASVVLFPVTVLNLAIIVTFGPVLGNVYSFAGWLSASAMGYGLGRAMGRNLLRKIASPRVQRFLRRAEGHGLASVLTIRLLPLAPFSIINLLVGASRIGFRDFIFGSVIGRIPGMIMLTFVGIQFESMLRNPGTGSFFLLGLTLLLIPLVTIWLSRRVESRNELERDTSKT